MNINRFLDTSTLHYAMRELEWAVPGRSRWTPFVDDSDQRELIQAYKDMPEESPVDMEIVAEADPAEINSWLETRSFNPVDFSSLEEGVDVRIVAAAAYHLLVDLDTEALAGSKEGEFQVPEDSIFGVAGLSGELYSVPFANGYLYFFRLGANPLSDEENPAIAVGKIVDYISFGEIYPIHGQYQLSELSAEGKADLDWMVGADLISLEDEGCVHTIVMADQQFSFEFHPDFLEITIATVVVIEPDVEFEETTIEEQVNEVEYTGLMWITDDTQDTVVVGASLINL
jgi:hypothetical protein